MNAFEFSEGFKKLANVYGTAKPEERAKAYFGYLFHFDNVYFQAAIDSWATREPRFPSVAELIAECRIKTPEHATTKNDCCTNGWVYLDDVEGVMRGNCVHGRAISEKFGPIGFGGSKFPRLR